MPAFIRRGCPGCLSSDCCAVLPGRWARPPCAIRAGSPTGLRP
ncbi:hypothetical protein C884_00114 [Kocuria palustris PEL]|uniref:Uncharacterized protein n=1 Tax=Kocuria palustris PEL TaxID=1236550 RepID=M2YHD5_9MICC|nr:hypothetical protein C884_00114 [Kocuria palustris PEL]